MNPKRAKRGRPPKINGSGVNSGAVEEPAAAPVLSELTEIRLTEAQRLQIEQMNRATSVICRELASVLLYGSSRRSSYPLLQQIEIGDRRLRQTLDAIMRSHGVDPEDQAKPWIFDLSAMTLRRTPE